MIKTPFSDEQIKEILQNLGKLTDAQGFTSAIAYLKELNDNLGDKTHGASSTGNAIQLLKQINSNFPIDVGGKLEIFNYSKLFETTILTMPSQNIWYTALDITNANGGFIDGIIVNNEYANSELKITIDGTLSIHINCSLTDAANGLFTPKMILGYETRLITFMKPFDNSAVDFQTVQLTVSSFKNYPDTSNSDHNIFSFNPIEFNSNIKIECLCTASTNRKMGVLLTGGVLE